MSDHEQQIRKLIHAMKTRGAEISRLEQQNARLLNRLEMIAAMANKIGETEIRDVALGKQK
jgi:hypothetical protein